MDERHLLWVILLLGVVTLYAVIVSADGISTEEGETAAAFFAGAVLVYIILTGKKPGSGT